VWAFSAGVSLGIALPYFAIAYFVTRGLVASRQLRSNYLGLGTALIFFSCGGGHLLHAEHVVFGGQEFRAAADLHMTLWDLSTAAIAVWYLSMRRRYGQLLQSPAMFEDHTRLAAEAQARHEADHDHLTGLVNRHVLMDAVKRALDPDVSHDTRGLLFIDLDGFKEINDRFGHLAGDALLIAAAERLRRALRPHDLLARLGGDEFVVLLGGAATEKDALAVARRQADVLSAPFGVAGELVTLTSSVGIALAAPGAVTAAELVHRADTAMYDAKSDGPGRYRFHAPVVHC